jgi:hypothetical protein
MLFSSQIVSSFTLKSTMVSLLVLLFGVAVKTKKSLPALR